MLTDTNIKTPSDLMSIALQAEREAIRRYTQLSSDMNEVANESAEKLFERMINEEIEHKNLLLKWMAKENILENKNIKPVVWKDPQVSTEYNDEARDPIYSTPYKALAFAVHNEEIAFRFYTHVAANSENEAVRKYAEILAREELGHAALLRAERRKAYHQERKDNIKEPRLDPKAIQHETDLIAAAIHIDRYLSIQMGNMGKKSPEIQSLANKTNMQISDHVSILNQHIKNESVSLSNELTQNLEQLDAYNSDLTEQNDMDSNIELQRLWSCCDRSFAFYDAIVETTEDEEIMHTAQQLSATALDRIGVLKHAFSENGN